MKNGERGKKCKVCDEVDIDPATRTPIEKLPHTLVTDPARSATCIEKGLTEGRHCSVCPHVEIAQREISKNPENHAEVEEVQGVEATCTDRR